MEAFRIKNGISAKRYLGTSTGSTTGTPSGFSLAGLSYDSKSFSVNSQEATPSGVTFKSDGTKMYIVGYSTDAVYQYSLSTAWDVSTASYDSVSLSISSQNTYPTDLTFSSDGTKLYVIGIGGADEVNQYNLSTAWDLSTASYNSVFAISEDGSPRGIQLSSDGTKMYVAGYATETIYEYNLGTAYSVSTAVYNSKSFSMSTLFPASSTGPESIYLKSDGTEMYILGSTEFVYKVTLSTAFDISSATYNNSVGSYVDLTELGTAGGLTFKPDGTKMYAIGSSFDTVFQYSSASSAEEIDLSAGSLFSLSPTSSISLSFTNPPASGVGCGFSIKINAQDEANLAASSLSGTFTQTNLNPSGIFVGDNGTKLYVCTYGDDRVRRYPLSTAYDITSAGSADEAFSVTSQAPNPRGVTFKPDGTELYVCDVQNGRVVQYSLSTAWSLNTASFSGSETVTAQATPYGVAFNNTGTKMYTVGTSAGYQYSLSTAWDATTSTYDSVTTGNKLRYNVCFNGDGSSVYSGYSGSLNKYTLSTAYDFSTISDNPSSTFNMTYEGGAPDGLFVKPDETTFYAGDVSDDVCRQFTVGQGLPLPLVEWPESVKWGGGVAPFSSSFGSDIYSFMTIDGGTTFYGVKGGGNIA
jgi:DNA-binding beta-propeller fold protein YncE